MRWVLDDEVRRLDRGRVLLGGSPLRFLRLSDAGAAAVDDLVAGRLDVAPALIDRLVDRGMARPVLGPPDGHDPSDPSDARQLTVVIPVRDRPGALDRALTALDAPAPDRVIVVDDGSVDAAAHAAVAARHGATVVRLDRSLGPAGARNAGLAAVVTAVVAFVDSDVTIEARALGRLAGHLADPRVALVAPRVRHRGGSSVLDRYESAASSLDLGPRAGAIRPRTRVAYVPAAAMVVRVESLRAVGGFDDSLSVGEDVDLCWRLDAAGHRLVYEPSIEACHDGRSTMRTWLARLGDYGTSAALLDARHPGQVPPVAVSTWSVAVWGLAVTGHPFAAAAGVLASGELLARKLAFLEHPRREAARLVGRGHLGAGRLLGQSLVRPYWPVTSAAALLSRRARRIAVVAVVGPVLLEYVERRPRLDPLRWTAFRLADHLAYATGVWRGVLRSGSAGARGFGALRPDLTGWPGRAVDATPAGARN